MIRKTDCLIKQSLLGIDVWAALRVAAALLLSFHKAAKIHKAGFLLLSIVSTIGSSTYRLAKHVTGLLSSYVGQTDSYIQQSAHFIEKLSSIGMGHLGQFWHHLIIHDGIHAWNLGLHLTVVSSWHCNSFWICTYSNLFFMEQQFLWVDQWCCDVGSA